MSFYADISLRLAKSFIKTIETGIENILTYPEAWQIVEGDVRRHLINRFPFGIYYHIFIYAVMHMSRQPDYWKHRIKSTRS